MPKVRDVDLLISQVLNSARSTLNQFTRGFLCLKSQNYSRSRFLGLVFFPCVLWLNDPTAKASERTNRKLAVIPAVIQLLVLYTNSEPAESHNAQRCRRTDDRMMPIVDDTVWLKLAPNLYDTFCKPHIAISSTGRLCNESSLQAYLLLCGFLTLGLYENEHKLKISRG